ncbi:YtzI protein [Virgibacillus dokdonensis]|uniref:YtzI protein n=1 Tax=Virgibacillus dokdonensis TaxID=302167 RepID=A0A3E0WQF0_9BACI|nr:YtzI protein [Virgibacillus dokdonensis]RFA35048.1 YtzI protein [Virgibacillus dokdonensis]
MSTAMIISIISIVVVILVLVFSLITINKGYAHQHEIDPLPKENDVNKGKET